MTVVVGLVGLVVALTLCAVMVRDVQQSRTVLTPWERMWLRFGRDLDRMFVEMGEALLAPLRVMADAVNDFHRWAVEVGLIEPEAGAP